MSMRWPWQLTLRAALQSLGLALFIQSSPADASTQVCREPATLRFDILSKIPRSEVGFTQGIEVHDDGLYESTGRIGGELCGRLGDEVDQAAW
jgi:glutamine cyclotransferase